MLNSLEIKFFISHTKIYSSSLVFYFSSTAPHMNGYFYPLNRPSRSIGMHMIPLKSRIRFRQSLLIVLNPTVTLAIRQISSITWTLYQ